MEYKAIVKRKSDDELQHWKYIKRVKGKNGKWQYYYDTANTDLQKYKNKLITNSSENIGNHTFEKRTEWKQHDGLFDKTEKSDWVKVGWNNDNSHNQYYQIETNYQGKLSRAAAKGEKWIFDNLISNDKKAPSQRNKKKNNNKTLTPVNKNYTAKDRTRKPV